MPSQDGGTFHLGVRGNCIDLAEYWNVIMILIRVAIAPAGCSLEWLDAGMSPRSVASNSQSQISTGVDALTSADCF
jgi:hypothetical protein